MCQKAQDDVSGGFSQNQKGGDGGFRGACRENPSDTWTLEACRGTEHLSGGGRPSWQIRSALLMSSLVQTKVVYFEQISFLFFFKKNSQLEKSKITECARMKCFKSFPRNNCTLAEIVKTGNKRVFIFLDWPLLRLTPKIFPF